MGMSITWTLAGRGWVTCVVADEHTKAEIIASYISTAPEDLLAAVARLILGETETEAQFEAEPTAYRWRFRRADDQVSVRLLELPDGRRHDDAGTEIWSSRPTVDMLARAVVRAFDDVTHKYGESAYSDQWGRTFPRSELESLRRAWRSTRE